MNIEIRGKMYKIRKHSPMYLAIKTWRDRERLILTVGSVATIVLIFKMIVLI